MAAYPGRKNRSQPEKTSALCSCQPTPAPLRNASTTIGTSRTVAQASSNAPGTNAGLPSSASANACSGLSPNRSPS